MLDEKTLKVLEFLNEHPDEAFSIYQMGQRGVPANFETLDWLHKHDMVSQYEDEDGYRDPCDGPEFIYQINAGGRSELRRQKYFEETEKRAKQAEIRAQKAEVRAQKAEVRAQKAEIRARISLVVSIIAVIVTLLR